jgi:hypothetical protein
MAEARPGAPPCLPLRSRCLQTITEAPHGNALAACAASILDLNLADVPNFVATADYLAAMQSHASEHGMSLRKVALCDGRFPEFVAPATLCIVRGTSPRGHGHVIVAAVSEDGVTLLPIHDPFPTGGFLEGFGTWAALYEPKVPVRGRDPHDVRAEAIKLLCEGRQAQGRAILARAGAVAAGGGGGRGRGGGGSPAPTATSSGDAPPPSAEPAALAKWCDAFLGERGCDLSLRDFSRTGRGLASCASKAGGEPALRIPLRLVLTARGLPRHPLLDSMHGDLRLALALLLEPIVRADGPWAR